MSNGSIAAQANLHHQYFLGLQLMYFLGLQLMVATREGREVVGNWMFRLFRRQHTEKFLSSFAKLGLGNQPDAIACAKYHALSNAVGGVRVEYMEESDAKAWIRFRYPRWMYDGPAICGIPVEASRGFLNGWYAHNGVSLGNPRLGFVCVSEDLTGQFGLCGYFKEYDHDLEDDERLRFCPDETPPPFDAAKQPRPPEEHWSEQRLAKGARNYAIEYCRNGIRELTGVIGRERALEIGKLAALLTGLQQYRCMADAVGAVDGDAADAAWFLAELFRGMGDGVELDIGPERNTATLRQSGLRIVRGIEGDDRDILLSCWIELWRGAVKSHRAFIDVAVKDTGDALVWALSARA